MRPEMYEYDFDWMLWRCMDAAGKIADGQEKETRRMLEYIPYFRDTAEAFVNLGKPGIAFMKMTSQYLENIVCARQQGKKVVMTTFCFSPSVFYAMDIVPVTLEVMTVLATALWKRGTADYMDYCVELGFTETSCSAQRGSLGAYLAGLGAEIDFIVTNTAGVCDTNANAFAFSHKHLNKPFYALNYPAGLTDEPSNQYHRDDFRGLVSFLEKQTGNSLDQDRLKEVLEETARQEKIIGEMEELQMMVPNPMPAAYNFILYGGRFMFSGRPGYTKLVSDMLEVVRDNAEKGVSGLFSGKERIRAFFFYIDHYNMGLSLWDFLDRHGISHLGGILSRSFKDDAPYMKNMEDVAYRIDTTDLDSMIDSIAMINSRMPMVRSIRGPYDRPNMWLDDSLMLAEIYRADCLIYNGTPGCRNTWSNVKLMAGDLEKAGYPTHIMSGDAFDERVESWESTSARLEEFFRIRGLL